MPAATLHNRSFSDRRAGCPQETDRLLAGMLATLPGDHDGFQLRCAAVPDWQTLMERAAWHGIAGVLYPDLTRAGSLLPPLLQAAAERRRTFERLAQSRLLATLDEALGAFYAAGVLAVALKGPILGERLYPDPSARLSSDLDFLVAPAELERAAAVLTAIGYRTETGPSADYYREHSHHIRLYRGGAPLIELHFRGYAGFGIIVPAAPLLARALPYRTARGHAVHVLAPEDEFLQLAVHAAGHCYGRLSWLYEIKLLHDHFHLDWPVVAHRARSWGISSAVALTCEMLRRRLGAAIPLAEDLPPPRGLRGRAAEAMLAVTNMRPQYSRTGLLGKLAFTVLLCDRPGSAASLAAHEMTWFVRRRVQGMRTAG